MDAARFVSFAFARFAALVSPPDHLTLEDIDTHIDWLERRRASIIDDLAYWRTQRFALLREHHRQTNATTHGANEHGDENR